VFGSSVAGSLKMLGKIRVSLVHAQKGKILKGLGKKNFSTAPLTEPFSKYSSIASQIKSQSFVPVKTESKLSNNIRVITVNNGNPTAAVGVFLNTGTRFESPENYGASFFLKHMAFKSTDKRSALRLTREFELLGSTYNVSVGREHTLFATELPSDRVPEVFPILDDILHPRIPEWEVRDVRHDVITAAKQVQTDGKAFVFDLLHQEAYRNRTLGLPLFPTSGHIEHLTDEILLAFAEKHYIGDRVAIVGVGAFEHNDFAKWADLAFGYEKRVHLKKNAAQYIGGDVRVNANADTHFALAFEGVSLESKDGAAIGVLQHLLGGASPSSSVSLGNSASRLSKNVLEKSNGGVKEVSAFNISYSDSGIFGVFAVADPTHAGKGAQSIAKEISSALKGFSSAELESAKRKFKHEILFTTEARSGLAEFLGHQAVTSNSLLTPAEFVKGIEAVTDADVKRVASKVFASKPTLAAVGGVESIPTAEELSALLRK